MFFLSLTITTIFVCVLNAFTGSIDEVCLNAELKAGVKAGKDTKVFLDEVLKKFVAFFDKLVVNPRLCMNDLPAH